MLATNPNNVQQQVLKALSEKLADFSQPANFFEKFKYSPVAYIRRFLNWKPWSGLDYDGQKEILLAYVKVIKQQEERAAYLEGVLKKDDLKYWQPGEIIQNWLRVEAGHAVGKTKVASAITSHFYDCFNGYGYCYAPTFRQVNDYLFKEIRADRQLNNLPGKVLEQPILKDPNNPRHVVKGIAVQGASTEDVQGQHEPYMLFVLDEAEGIPSFVYDAVSSMASGAIAVVLLLANPRTRISRFHKIRGSEWVKSFRMSCLNHPNVTKGYQLVPGAVQRSYVDMMIDEHCQKVLQHDNDYHTFEVTWRSGIYLPNNEFMFRVMGMAPEDTSGDTFCPVGRFTAAKDREQPEVKPIPGKAFVGVDCARYGDDLGSVFLFQDGVATHVHSIRKQDGYEYYIKVRELLSRLKDEFDDLNIDKADDDRLDTEVEVRVDGGGGYGSTLIDNLVHDEDVWEWFSYLSVIEVHFNHVAYDDTQFSDLVTEMYYHASQSLRVITLQDVTDALEVDLTERRYNYVKRKGVDVKKLTAKESFKKQFGRSPDDGDGFVLAVSPSYLFTVNVNIGFA